MKKPTYSLKGANGKFYLRKDGRLWESKSFAMASAMAVIAEKEQKQKFEVKSR